MFQIDRQPRSSDWRVVGGLENDDIFRFIVVTPGMESKRAVYDAAASALCEQPTSPRICVLHFFAKDDPIPPRQPKKQFFATGGFRDYGKMLAVYWRNHNSGVAEYTKWDCKRAGVDGAPLSSLCDPAVQMAYEAALALGGRTGNAQACGWPETEDFSNFLIYLSTVQDPLRREMYRKGFDAMNSGKGPDHLSDCGKLQTKMEERATVARLALGIPQPIAQQSIMPSAPLPLAQPARPAAAGSHPTTTRSAPR